MGKVMVVKLDGVNHELGPCETQGAMHVVRLTESGRALYLANKPDTELVQLVGDDLQVRASFIRHTPTWRVEGPAPVRVPAESQPAPAPVTAPAEPAVIDADDEPSEDDAADVENYQAMGKPQLVELCEARGIATTTRMNKGELAELLHDDDLNG